MEEKYVPEKYLPLGSVVLLRGGEKRVMIYGRRQEQLDTGDLFDYVACLYPEGNLDERYMYLFNHEDIAQVFFIGFQDSEELEFRRRLLQMPTEPLLRSDPTENRSA